MEKNIRKKLKSTKGITLVALIVTIIVLLILAAVSLSAVFSQDGIFSRAEQATDKYSQAKARETLEIVLSDAQMQKYTNGLTDEQLTDKINSIGEDIKEGTNPQISQAIVEGYIFEVDRTVPKILDYIGPADGIIITASVNGLSNGWMKPEEIANISITGKIITYSGGNITTVSAVKDGTEISGFSIGIDGSYIINNITTDTTIIINAQDSNGKTNSKAIPIEIKIDNIAPVVDSVNATAEGLKIKFSATGHDNESGIKHFNYTIISTQDTTLEGIPADKRAGTFTLGQTVEIVTTPTGNRDETTYTITVTATDNAGNVSTNETADVTAIDGITVAEAKELVNTNTLREYIGKRVIDYTPKAGGIWRVFYYDGENDGNDNGDFGKSDTLYLKRDYDENLIIELDNDYSGTNEGIDIMKNMNPLWRDSIYGENVNVLTKLGITKLCEPLIWNDYKQDNVANYAIGGPSIEMFAKAYNIWKNDKENLIVCRIGSQYGYYVGEKEPERDDTDTWSIEIESGPNKIFSNGKTWIISSPGGIWGTYGLRPIMVANRIGYILATQWGACPIVSIKT